MSNYRLYKDRAGEWRWTFIAANGEPIAKSTEGYVNERDCRHAIDLMKDSAGAPVTKEA